MGPWKFSALTVALTAAGRRTQATPVVSSARAEEDREDIVAIV